MASKVFLVAKSGRPLTNSEADGYISAAIEFNDPPRVVPLGSYIWDAEIKGLRVRIGSRKASWSYFREHVKHGHRSTTFRPLGTFPSVNTEAARRAAQVVAGEIAGGVVTPGRRQSTKLTQAFDAYLDHLSRKAADKGKPARWRYNVEKLRKLFAKFERWSLAELSQNPAAVAKWHREISEAHGKVSANHAARVLRALYRRAARTDLSLSKVDLPTAGVDWNKEQEKQEGLAPIDFPKWRAAWERIESDTHKAYALFCLLTGMRPGEAARLRFADIQPKSRAIIVPNAKAGNEILIPLSGPIARVLRMARDAADDGEPLIFAGCAQLGHRLELPARGMELRHTYATIAAACKIPELDRHFLMGHAPDGISKKYVLRLQAASGPSMREAQRKISKRIMELLGEPLTTLVRAPALSPDGPQDADAMLLPALP